MNVLTHTTLSFTGAGLLGLPVRREIQIPPHTHSLDRPDSSFPPNRVKAVFSHTLRLEVCLSCLLACAGLDKHSAKHEV